MNQLRADFVPDPVALQARLALLVQRLALEVARLRALRGDGRSEAFAGLLLSDADITALCDELAAVDLPDMTGAGDALDRAEAVYAAGTSATRLTRLVALYDLDATEEALLVLAMAPAVDPRFARVYGFLHEDMARQVLTPALAQRLMAPGLMANDGIDALRDLLSPQGRLLRHGLLDLTGDSWITARLTMPDAMVGLLLADPVVPDGVTVLPLPSVAVWGDRPRLVVAGADTDPVMSGGFGGVLWLSRSQSLPDARQAGVMAAMAGASVAFAGWDAAPEADRRALAASLGCHATVITAMPDRWDGLGISLDCQVCAASAHADRLAFWLALVPAAAALLAASRLDTAVLWRLVQDAAPDAAPLPRLAAMIRRQNAAPMRGLADPVPCTDTLDDLILPVPAKARLCQFAGRRGSAALVLERWGLGPALAGRAGGIALFTGPSGVGKTMAAGVVARLAGLDLMRINLATVVSKYIGETEGNLERIFTAAAQGEVILFFDEAEALFSKRAEVRDARDRYANMEMSYLLQRLESFGGMAILASNMGATLDPALLRRFDLVLEFALPDAAARRLIWAKLRTTGVPLARDVDLEALADRFDLAGGHIRQAILTAAHAAAQAGSEVTQGLLVQGVAREYAKLGRTLRREDFGAEFAQVRGG